MKPDEEALKPVELEPPAPSEPPMPELSTVQKVAAFLEKARLAEYLDLMNRPLRMMWLNFLAGVARGVGMVVGGSIVGVLLVFVVIRGLKTAFHKVGGLPMIGDQLKEFIGWILHVVNQHQGG